MTRPPLQGDWRLVLRSPLEDVSAVLSGPVAMAGWFSVTREPVDRDGAVVVVRPDQYVSGIFPLDAHAEIGDYFAGVFEPVK